MANHECEGGWTVIPSDNRSERVESVYSFLSDPYYTSNFYGNWL